MSVLLCLIHTDMQSQSHTVIQTHTQVDALSAAILRLSAGSGLTEDKHSHLSRRQDTSLPSDLKGSFGIFQTAPFLMLLSNGDKYFLNLVQY